MTQEKLQQLWDEAQSATALGAFRRGEWSPRIYYYAALSDDGRWCVWANDSFYMTGPEAGCRAAAEGLNRRYCRFTLRDVLEVRRTAVAAPPKPVGPPLVTLREGDVKAGA